MQYNLNHYHHKSLYIYVPLLGIDLFSDCEGQGRRFHASPIPIGNLAHNIELLCEVCSFSQDDFLYNKSRDKFET